MKLHAAERLAGAMIPAIVSEVDPRTLATWSRLAGRSEGSLRIWCSAAGVRPKPALDFARLLRAVALAEFAGTRVEDVLDVVDERTLSSLLSRGGLKRDSEWTVTAFLRSQRLITNESTLSVIVLACHDLPLCSGKNLRISPSTITADSTAETV